MPRVTVGVDVGKGTHQAAAYDPAADRVVVRVTFPVSRAGFERFRLFPERLAPEPDDVLVALEATGHYHLTLVEFLAEHGYAVVLINPYQAAQFRRSQGGKAKTDRIDARALARFLAVSAPMATPLSNETLAGLRELTCFRAELVRDRTVALNRLYAALDARLPGAAGGARPPHDQRCPRAAGRLSDGCLGRRGGPRGAGRARPARQPGPGERQPDRCP